MVVAILRRIVTPSKYCFSVIDQSFAVVSCPKSNLFSFFVVIFSALNALVVSKYKAEGKNILQKKLIEGYAIKLLSVISHLHLI